MNFNINDYISENDTNDEMNHKNNYSNKETDDYYNIINEEVKTTSTSSSLNNSLETPSIEDSDCKSEITNNKVFIIYFMQFV